uniref:Uncharacterized protein n=1 Tax=Chromera velia CCMP2878 TaxID=1169474 RepID=A0A0G4I8Z5_9ALVE|eukprot:Cvel_12039.t1-p1 / transcript=Cvel_12039.t1 / gene=Cvel_12039 / organism=Chromera_velia_CCMP2878 / gene_product=hypothetical protein / transcript_product=hypothetical protein / location=Cvel_scaffold773:48643-51343(-) / protein_length=766 / sequence_SO=supercontig / SO=protein_coding / is_pseudo=false
MQTGGVGFQEAARAFQRMGRRDSAIWCATEHTKLSVSQGGNLPFYNAILFDWPQRTLDEGAGGAADELLNGFAESPFHQAALLAGNLAAANIELKQYIPAVLWSTLAVFLLPPSLPSNRTLLLKNLDRRARMLWELKQAASTVACLDFWRGVLPQCETTRQKTESVIEDVMDYLAVYTEDNPLCSLKDRLKILCEVLEALSHVRHLSDCADTRNECLQPCHLDIDSFPQGLDSETCRDLLKCWHLLSKVFVPYAARLSKGVRLLQGDRHTRMVGQRVRGNEEVRRWWQRAPLGDVRIHTDSILPSYQQLYIHPFSNVQYQSRRVRGGEVHVGVGFVDLGFLLFADVEVGTSADSPVTWVGLDESAYVCAKTCVLAEMLRINASVESVAQVWFSSTWSAETVEAFKAAVQSVLCMSETPARGAPRRWAAEETPAVREFLQQWLRAGGTSIEEARRRWLNAQTSPNVEAGRPWKISALKAKADRAALSRLLLTGEVPALPASDVGSITFWCNPRGTAGVENNGVFLQTLSHTLLWSERLRSEKSDVVSCGSLILQSRIASLQKRLVDGTFSVDLRCAKMQRAGGVVREIASLSPQTVSWSNLCDYFSSHDFHAMARESAPSACHLMHSMNWRWHVKGASLIDYESERQEEVYQQSVEVVSGQLLESARGGESLPVENGMSDLVVCPSEMLVHGTLENVVDSALTQSHARLWVERFVSRAAAAASPHEGGASLEHVHAEPFSIFSRSFSTAFFSLKYNASSFHADSVTQ